jgi:hypothetical protein
MRDRLSRIRYSFLREGLLLRSCVTANGWKYAVVVFEEVFSSSVSRKQKDIGFVDTYRPARVATTSFSDMFEQNARKRSFFSERELAG